MRKQNLIKVKQEQNHKLKARTQTKHSFTQNMEKRILEKNIENPQEKLTTEKRNK